MNNNFGPFSPVKNIYIHNGKLGLTSHHGIHSNDSQNIRIENIQISHFEVAGLQFNGFKNVKLINVEIGPSSTNVKRML